MNGNDRDDYMNESIIGDISPAELVVDTDSIAFTIKESLEDVRVINLDD